MPLAILLGAVVIAVLAFKVSPWPGALLVRTMFNKDDRRVLAALQNHTPAAPITVLSNQSYLPGNQRALLDVYMPTGIEHTTQTRPVVIWTHGGAWVSGDKTDDGPYFKLLAAQNVIVVSVNYSLAPEKRYPTQIEEINSAYGYVVANANRLHINPGKIFIAGDSAGAQLTSQMAAIITDPAYAKEVGITPSLNRSQVAGTILFCGIYKMEQLVEADPSLPKLLSWGDDQVVWAYSGVSAKTGPLIQQMSPYYHVTANFPPTFVSGGNADPLTLKQSMPLASKLQGLGVSVDTLFYPANHRPSLAHEYQFNLDDNDGQKALAAVVQFLARH